MTASSVHGCVSEPIAAAPPAHVMPAAGIAFAQPDV